jgi:hypothetical protein
MQSKAATVAEYLGELPEDRRAAIMQVREMILANLNEGFEEGMQYGMIGYYVPHSLYPPGYHCDPKQPLCFAGLASQKNYMSLYIMSVYGDDLSLDKFETAWAKTGKKLDMGKSCIRFKKVDDLALDVLAAFIKRSTVKSWIDFYERALKPSEKTKKAPAAKPAPRKKAAKKKPAAKAKPAKKKGRR